MRRALPIAVLLLLGGAATIPDTPINKGLLYLKQTQNADGSWSAGARQLCDTAASIETLSVCLKDPQIDSGFEFMRSVAPRATDETSRTAMALTFSTDDLTALRDSIADRQNPDGGWGGGKKAGSSPLDSALAIRPLGTVRALDAGAVNDAIDYLAAQQLASGGWALQPDGPEAADATGDLATTAIIVTALAQYQFDQSIPTPQLQAILTAAEPFLLSFQNVDDSFGAGVWETAWTVRALVRLDPDGAACQQAKAFLEAAQLANGSWADDVRLTALATIALYEKENPPIPPRPDLSPSSLTVTPASPAASDSTLLEAQVANVGGRTAFNVEVQFRVDGVPIGASIFTPALAKDQSAPASLVTNLPAGNHTVSVHVDPQDLIPELDEANNTASQAVTVGAASLADLAVLSSEIVLSETSPQAGEQFTLSVPVRNIGGSTATGILVRLFDGDPAAGGVQRGRDRVIAELAAGSQNTLQFAPILEEGAHELFVVVDPLGLVSEDDETNNKASKAVAVIGDTLPDFFVTESVIEFLPGAGGATTVRATIRNATAVSPIEPAFRPNVRLRFLDNGTPFGGDFVIPFVDPGPGSIAQVVASFAPGSHVIAVEIDPFFELAEVTRGNNLAVRALSVGAAELPDLLIDSIVPSTATPLSGELVSLSVKVKNVGAAAAGPFDVRVLDGPPGPVARAIGFDARVESLAAGAETTLVVGWVPPAGTRSAFAIADVLSVVGEVSESNNTRSVNVSVSATPFVPAIAASQRGTEFWAAFLPSHRFNASPDPTAELVIQSDVSTTFEVTAPGFSQSGNVAPGVPATVSLPASLHARTALTLVPEIQNKGIRITGDDPISVIWRTPAGGAGDYDGAYRVLPASALRAYPRRA